MKHQIIYIALVLLGFQVNAQDLTDILESQLPKNEVEYVEATFKGTRIINGHSVENRKKGTLEFLISHRFGRINSGAEELFGLDQSNIRLALEYAIIDDLMVGLGRSSFDKTFDGFVKYKFLKQQKGKGAFPFSASFFGSAAYDQPTSFGSEPKSFSTNLTYTSQLLIASKISPAFSFQITPTFIHRNSVVLQADPQNIFAIGTGARMKITNRMAVSAEYFYQFDELASLFEPPTNSLAFAVEFETGGHVFQIILSNTITMIEKSFITETTGDFFDGDIHLGFNISRAFQVGRHGKKKTRNKKNIEKRKEKKDNESGYSY